jgi:hypothetical protein
MGCIVACCCGSSVGTLTSTRSTTEKKRLSIPGIGKYLSSPQGPDWMHGPVFGNRVTGTRSLGGEGADAQY